MTSCSRHAITAGFKIIGTSLFKLVGYVLLIGLPASACSAILAVILLLNTIGLDYAFQNNLHGFPAVVAAYSSLDVSTAGWLLVGVDILLGTCALVALACYLGSSAQSQSLNS